MIAYTSLRGKLERDNSGTKIVNGSTNLALTTKWSRGEYKTTESLDDVINIEDRAVALVMGKCIPPLVAIDADTLYSKDVLLQLISSNPKLYPKLLAYSNKSTHGKDGLHLIYEDTAENEDLYRALGILDSSKKKLTNGLDIIRGDNLLFLANKGNLTKAINYSLSNPDAKSIPPIVQTMVKGLVPTAQPHTQDKHYDYSTSHLETNLATLLSDFQQHPSKRAELIDSLIQLRCPRDMKNEEYFPLKSNGSLDISATTYKGKPHQLLMAMSIALKNDIGVTKELHTLVLQSINALLPHSKNLQGLQNELIDPDTKDPYPYKEDWQTMSVSLVNKRNHILNIYSVSVSSETKIKGVKFIVHNSNNNEILLFPNFADLKNELISDTGMPGKNISALQPRIQPVSLIARPDKQFGLNSVENSRHQFNMYQRTIVQDAFYNPELHSEGRRYPQTILKLLYSQFGEDKTESLLLPFLRHKLNTRNPTALIFALMGPPYSFKTGFFEGILRPLFSSDRYLKTNGDILTEKYNDYLIDLDILALDEFHHLQHTQLLKPVVQTLNKFGSEFHEGIRRMHTTVSKGEDIPQEITPWIAMNKVVSPVTEIVGERRLVVGYATKTASQALNLSDEAIKQRVKSEIVDFSYYLATQVGNISYKDYNLNTNWKTVDDHYYRFMDESISFTKKVALAVGSAMEKPNFSKLKQLVEPRNLKDMVVHLKRTTKGSKYRLRLWASLGGEYESPTPSVLDSIDDYSLNKEAFKELSTLLANNPNVYSSMVSDKIRCRVLDLVVSELELLDNGLLDSEFDIEVIDEQDEGIPVQPKQ